jgi:peptidoglycan/LPS O-acetylase OafA/YrhL
MQFYLLFALTVWTAGKLRCVSSGRLLLIFAALCVGSYPLHIAILDSARSTTGTPLGPALTHSLLAHLPLFALGALSAFLFVVVQRRTKRVTQFIAADVVVGCCVIALAAILGTSLDERVGLRDGRYNFPVVPLLLCIVLAATPFAKYVGRTLELPPLRFLGVISFGIYVYHLPCLGAVVHAMDYGGIDPSAHPAATAACGLALSIAVASFSFYFIEQPILALPRGANRLQSTAGRIPEGKFDLTLDHGRRTGRLVNS